MRDGPAPAEERDAGPTDERGMADAPGSAVAFWLLPPSSLEAAGCSGSGTALPPGGDGGAAGGESLAGGVAACEASGASGGVEAPGGADEDAPAESGRTSGTVLL